MTTRSGADRDRGLAGAAGALRSDQGRASARAVRRRSRRGERFAAGRRAYLDYSKNRVTDETAAAAAARRRARRARSGAMRCSAARRSTSPRSAPCCTSRCARRAATRIVVDGQTWCRRSTRCSTHGGFADRVRSGAGRATPASASATSINIGIGGSDLGPEMAYRGAAASTATATMTFRFVSNVDGADFTEATQRPGSRPRRCSSSRPRRSPPWRR